ncbi:Imm27 family immunity protein [Roseibium aggregatum]|uniref:Uncharacterized protein n=1 Tax=Roseibium aggregatum TaxID=187304 RepID=A0A926P1Z2_9HYPH|nr:hypothetical protein [Roseibium aggregatum]
MRTSKQEYFGSEALAFARELRKTRVVSDSWVTEYVDPRTGEVWILDYPNSEHQGGGPPRLRLKSNRT